MRSFIGIRHVLMGDLAAIKVLKNALCFIMGYFVAMETYVTLLLLMYVFAMYILYVQSMCVPILRSIVTTLTNLENMQKSYVLFDVT